MNPVDHLSLDTLRYSTQLTYPMISSYLHTGAYTVHKAAIELPIGYSSPTAQKDARIALRG